MFEFSDDEATYKRGKPAAKYTKKTWRQHVFKSGMFKDQTLLQCIQTGKGRGYLRFLASRGDEEYETLNGYIKDALAFYELEKKKAAKVKVPASSKSRSRSKTPPTEPDEEEEELQTPTSSRKRSRSLSPAKE